MLGSEDKSEIVGFHNATFSWISEVQAAANPEQRNFLLHIEDVEFSPGCVNLVIGSVI